MRITWQQIISGIIAFLALIAIFAYIFPIQFKAASNFLQLTFIPPEREFVPYESSDKVIIDSLNGLRCAINSVAAGAIGKDYSSVCPEHDPILSEASLKDLTAAPQIEEGTETAKAVLSGMNNINSSKQLENLITGAIISGKAVEEAQPEEEKKEEPCTGLKFGGVCVECFDILTFSKNKEIAVQQLVSETLDCWRAFQANEYNNIYCGKLRIPSDFAGEISERAFCKALDNSGSLGGDLAGSGTCGVLLLGENYEWEIGTLKAGSAPFYLCGDNRLGNEIFLTRDPKKCVLSQFYSVEDLKDYTCIVRNFELPQKIDETGSFNPVRWVAGYNDPNYIVYHQSFPRGADQFWHVDAISAFSVGLTIGFAVFDIAGPFLKAPLAVAKNAVLRTFGATTAKEAGELATREMTETGIKTAIVNFFKTIRSKGWKRTIRETFLKESFERTYVGLSGDAADALAKQADSFFGSRLPILNQLRSLRRLAAKISPSYKGRLQDALEKEFLETLNTKGIGLSDDFFLDYLGPHKKFVIGSSLEKELREEALEAYKSKIAKEMAQEAVERQTQTLTKSAAREMLKEIRAQNFFGNLFKETMGMTDDKVVKDALVKTLKQADSLPFWSRKYVLDQATELTDQFFDDKGLLNVVKIFGGETAEKTTKEATEKTTNEFFDSLTKALLPEQREKFIQQAAEAGWEGSKKAVKFSAKAAWADKEKYLLATGLAMYFLMQEAANEKYESVGLNSLAVDRPGLISVPIDFELGDAAAEFFITPRLHKRSRFYLASPCKADLIIQQDLCSCYRMPAGVQHIPINADYPPIDAKFIKLDENTLRDEDYIYNYVKEADPKLFKDYTQFPNDRYASEEECIQEAKSFAEDWKIIWEKYPETSINISEITDAKYALVVRERTVAAQWFTNLIEGIHVGGTGDILSSDVFLAEAEEKIKAGSSMVRTFERYKPYYDLSEGEMQCYDRGTMDGITSVLKIAGPLYKDFFLASYGLGTVDPTWERYMPKDINSNPYAHPKYVVPCLTVSISRHEGWNDGINYCIDEYTYLGFYRGILFASQIAISVVASALGDGIGGGIAMAITGIGAGYFEESWARQAKWPAVEEQGDDIPIAQSSWTESEWTMWGGTE